MDFFLTNYMYRQQASYTGKLVEDATCRNQKKASVLYMFGGFGYLTWAERKKFAKYLRECLDTRAMHGGLLFVEEQLQVTCAYEETGELSRLPYKAPSSVNPGYVFPTSVEMDTYFCTAMLPVISFT
jgi:hypothetical protein